MRRVLLIVLMLAIAGIVAVAIFLVQRDDDFHATLPDGKQIEFLGTAVGSATFTTEKRWHQLAKNWLPARFQSWIPSAAGGSCSSGTNSVTVYVRVTDPTGAPILNTPWASYMTQDDTGFRNQRDGGYCKSGDARTGQIYGLILRAFARRQSSFQFQFLDGHGAVIAGLRVPNPVRGPFPQWRPSGLPQTQTNGPVTLTLEAVQGVGKEPWRSVSPKWRLVCTDPAWTRARARHITLKDATGNEGQMLSRREPAWKVCAVVHREQADDFEPTERLSLTNLPVPKSGTFEAIDQQAERLGVKLTVHVLAGAGRLFVTNGTLRAMLSPNPPQSGHWTSWDGKNRVESWGNQTAFFLVEAQRVQLEDEIRLRLFDDSGREIELGDSSGYDGLSGGGRMYKRGFTPPADAEFLSLEIIVSRPLAFEFTIHPADVRPASQ